MRVVLDTNVLIAAALKGGLAEQILRLAITKDLTVITSKEILLELGEKLISKFAWSDAEVHHYLQTLQEITQVVAPTKTLNVVKTDPDDNKILEVALEGKAELVVSIDQDLLKLKSFQTIGIVHPKTLTWILPKLFEKEPKEK